MTDDLDAWNRLAALLPPAEAGQVADCWQIGEQEAGLGLLVTGLLAHRIPIDGATRAEIAVIAEAWGERATLAPALARCVGAGGPDRLVLLAEQARGAGADAEVSGSVRVPWIACTGCGAVLTRLHEWEPWGELSYLALGYLITSADGSAVLRRFPDDAVDRAFAALLAHPC
ncbi:hypothetical protein [Kitasatospora viridis]|uniref:hypothetical protein n=1 Tax=Kitasatospora viridis TaxID=281105 RepID=UPI00119EFD76|nr:hypothetical protein [Kitasatospora viridis]